MASFDTTHANCGQVMKCFNRRLIPLVTDSLEELNIDIYLPMTLTGTRDEAMRITQ